jgi:hypothetical protein
MRLRRHWLVLAWLGAVIPAGVGELQRYETEHYVLYTDLDEAGVREAKVRLGLMVQLYTHKTKEFSRPLRGKLPCYLITERDEYVEATGAPNSAGLYVPGRKARLYAHIDPLRPARGWKTLQHEGFHQFADQVMGHRLPVWVNEGLAEYFEEAIFAGDRFVEGVLPHGRIMRMKRLLEEGQALSLETLLTRSRKEWNLTMGHAQAASTQYLQAWSLVHFLGVARDGRYQRDFARYIQDVTGGKPPLEAWKQHFRDTDRIERQWRKYWRELPPEVAVGSYLEANVAIMTNFLARSYAAGRRYRTATDFLFAVEGGATPQPASQWLPPGLGQEHARLARQLGRWVLRESDDFVELTCHADGGWVGRGRFTVGNGRVQQLGVAIEADGAARRFERYR